MELTDFYRCYDFLLANWYALSKQVQREAEKVRYDLHNELASWERNKPKPRWDVYGERINSALRRDGMPAFFVAG